jgi:NADPH:quinone reductase-like Zn-dependent oxidoreductase
LSLLEAASLPENYFTVWHNVFERGHLESGDVPRARRLERHRAHGHPAREGRSVPTVFTTVGNDEKARFCRAIGADHVINYREKDFLAEVQAITGKKGVDLVLDMVGGDYVDRTSDRDAEGRLVQIAFPQGSKVTADWRFIMMKRLTVTGSTMRASPCPRERSASLRALRERVWPLFGEASSSPS